MNEKQVNRWLRRKFTLVGWVLIGYFILMNILTTAVVLWEMVGQSLGGFRTGDLGFLPDMEAVTGNAWGYILTVAVGLYILHAWKGGDYWKQELAVKDRPMNARVFFFLVSLCMGAQLVNTLWVGLLETIMNGFGKSLMPMLESVSGFSDTFSMFLYMAILAPISEEILFRGFVLRSLRPFGKRFAIFTSAFLFGIFHGNLLQTPFAFLVGLLLGYVTVEYSIYWAIALHGFNNLILGDLLSRLTGLLPDLAYNIVNGALFGSFALISLVILILNRHEIRAYRDDEWMDRRCLKCFFTNSGIIVLSVLMLAMMAMVMAV